MQAAHILITGFVQGVGFRQSVKRKARSLQINGWVRNLPDGSVEAIAFGDKDKVHQLIEFCKQGPFLSEVHNVAVSWDDTGEEFVDFVIKVP